MRPLVAAPQRGYEQHVELHSQRPSGHTQRQGEEWEQQHVLCETTEAHEHAAVYMSSISPFLHNTLDFWHRLTHTHHAVFRVLMGKVVMDVVALAQQNGGGGDGAWVDGEIQGSGPRAVSRCLRNLV